MTLHSNGGSTRTPSSSPPALRPPAHPPACRLPSPSAPYCVRRPMLPGSVGSVWPPLQRIIVNLAAAAVAVLLMSTRKTGGTCNEEQIDACRESALDDRLSALKSGGQCSPKRYAEFSHLCSVTNYLPNVEFCCCIYETSILCCRYHQDWNLFRCQINEDLIDTTSGSLEDLSGETDTSVGFCCPPLKLLLPAILVPLLAVLCCLYVCFKYWRQCGDVTCSASTAATEGDRLGHLSPQKIRATNDSCVADMSLSGSLAPPGDRSAPSLPFTRNGHVTPSLEKSAFYPEVESEPRLESVKHHSPFRDDDDDDDDEGGRRGIHFRSAEVLEPSAPPLFDQLDTSAGCAFTRCYHEELQEPYEEVCSTRYRDLDGRAQPLYRAARNSSFRSAPLVHRGVNIGGYYHFRPTTTTTAHCDGGATCRTTRDSSPPPPSYEQSCNENS